MIKTARENHREDVVGRANVGIPQSCCSTMMTWSALMLGRSGRWPTRSSLGSQCLPRCLCFGDIAICAITF
jgi:hypothetical protein